MTIIVSLFLLVVGVAMILNNLLRRVVPPQEFPRYGAPARWNPRIVPLTIGLLLAGGGVALLVFSRMGSP
jgi:hypothetical protein